MGARSREACSCGASLEQRLPPAGCSLERTLLRAGSSLERTLLPAGPSLERTVLPAGPSLPHLQPAISLSVHKRIPGHSCRFFEQPLSVSKQTTARLFS